MKSRKLITLTCSAISLLASHTFAAGDPSRPLDESDFCNVFRSEGYAKYNVTPSTHDFKLITEQANHKFTTATAVEIIDALMDITTPPSLDFVNLCSLKDILHRHEISRRLKDQILADRQNKIETPFEYLYVFTICSTNIDDIKLAFKSFTAGDLAAVADIITEIKDPNVLNDAFESFMSTYNHEKSSTSFSLYINYYAQALKALASCANVGVSIQDWAQNELSILEDNNKKKRTTDLNFKN
jgi:hypothetical protein